MQCLTDLIFLHVAVESIFTNPQSALVYHYIRQSFESEYPDFYFLRPCLIENLETPQCSRLCSLPKNECVYICDLSDLTLQIACDAWWASMNVGSKRPIA